MLGWVGTDGDGLAGLEYAKRHASCAAATASGGSSRTRSASRSSLQETKRAEPGKDLRLTLDAELQGKVEDVLAQVGLDVAAEGRDGARHGPVLQHDPRARQLAARRRQRQRAARPTTRRRTAPSASTTSRARRSRPFTVAGALEEKVVTPDDIFHLPPTINVADRTIKEAHERGTVDLSTTQILAQSSNVGTVRIGQRLGATRFDHWVRRFGFGRTTGVELPGEESGQVLKRDDYSGSSMGNLPIGQGESVTPLQLATAYSAIANGGILRRPADHLRDRRRAHARRRAAGA